MPPLELRIPITLFPTLFRGLEPYAEVRHPTTLMSFSVSQMIVEPISGAENVAGVLDLLLRLRKKRRAEASRTCIGHLGGRCYLLTELDEDELRALLADGGADEEVGQ